MCREEAQIWTARFTDAIKMMYEDGLDTVQESNLLGGNLFPEVHS